MMDKKALDKAVEEAHKRVHMGNKMRTRKEIEEEVKGMRPVTYKKYREEIVIELLLDIRDLLLWFRTDSAKISSAVASIKKQEIHLPGSSVLLDCNVVPDSKKLMKAYKKLMKHLKKKWNP